jgi:hypothetical protein
MPLVPSSLEAQLISLFTIDSSGRSNDGTGPSASEKAAKLTQIIDSYIKTATVTIPAGTPIQTTAGPGTITAPMTGTVS